jgi:predicted ATPase/tetratricopeptide (TPR) repeat protein
MTGPAGEPGWLTGREREISELRELARGTRLLTLCGPAGIGKTRLLDALLLALTGDHPDGSVLAGLGDLPRPSLLPVRVAQEAGICEEAGIPVMDTLAGALRHRRLVLGLDGCESLPGACACLARKLLAAAPGLLIVTASREPLGAPGEIVWTVPPLALPPAGEPPPGPAPAGSGENWPGAVRAGAVRAGSAQPGAAWAGAAGTDVTRSDAVRLFISRATVAGSDWVLDAEDGAAVAAICRAAGGVPLAIELAAARLREFTVAELSARLAAGPEPVPEAEPSGTPGLPEPPGPADPASQALQRVIGWSHDLLDPEEQMLLRRLSVMPGWSLEMAERVCSDDRLPPARVSRRLVRLVRTALVEPEPGPGVPGDERYQMPGAVREFAAARLAEAGETRTLEHRMRDYTAKRAGYVMSIATAKVPVSWPVLRKLFISWQADATNIRAVLDRCLRAGDVETGLIICAELGVCWSGIGALAEGITWHDAFLAASAGTPPGIRGPALVMRALLAFFDRDVPSGREHGTAGLEQCREAGDQYFTAMALDVLARLALSARDPEQALRYTDEAWELAQGNRDWWNQAYVLNTRASTLAMAGRPAEARETALAGLALTLDTDQRWAVAVARILLGNLAEADGDLDGARAQYLAALPLLRESFPPPAVARCLARLGSTALRQGDLARARTYLAESLQISVAAGQRAGIARGLLGFADLAASAGSADRAVRLAAAATAVRDSAGLTPPHDLRQRHQQAAAILGQPETARVWAEGLELASAAATRLALGDP